MTNQDISITPKLLENAKKTILHYKNPFQEYIQLQIDYLQVL